MAIFISIFIVYIVVISLYALYSSARTLAKPKQVSYEKGAEQKVLVIVPCKGIDITLTENLRSIANQSYRNFRAVAVVDSDHDKAIGSIKAAGLDWIVTSKRFNKGSGKVNALATAINRFRGHEIYVFADSDITARKDWLSNLVAPLSQPDVGLSSTFPFFVPMGGFWSDVKSVWGLVGIGMMESETLRFGWGGSLAFRSGLLDTEDLEEFSKAVSDDIAITSIVKKKGLKMAYVSEAAPMVRCRETFSTFFEWANRQTALSIRGNITVFWAGIIISVMDTALLVSGVVFGFLYSWFAFLLLAPFAMHTYRNFERVKGSPARSILINAMMPLMFLINLIVAKQTTSITWRGREYKLRQDLGDKR